MRWKTVKYGMKIWESGPNMHDGAISCALQMEAIYKAKSRRSKGWQVRVIQEPSAEQKDEIIELLKQNKLTLPWDKWFKLLSEGMWIERGANVNKTVGDWDRILETVERGTVFVVITGVISLQNILKSPGNRQETSRDWCRHTSVGRKIRKDPRNEY